MNNPFIDDINECMRELNEKAIEELKNKEHGRWIPDGADYYCSVCNTIAPKSRTDTDPTWFPVRYDFCPYCGADLRETDSNITPEMEKTIEEGLFFGKGGDCDV